MAGTSSQCSELSLSCICMVSDVRDEDIHDSGKKLVKGAGAIGMAENRGCNKV